MGTMFLNNVKTALLLGLMTALILFIGGAIGSRYGSGNQGLIIALIIAGVMNLGAYFFSDKIALATMRAQQVGPEHPLYQITAELVQRANMPMPRVYVSPEQAPNAFATGRNPNHAAVCATEGLLQVLSRNEIAGVMAHELAHVRHRDILIQSIAATIGAAIGFLAHMAMWGGFGGRRDEREEGGGAGAIFAILGAILAPLAAALIQAAISRSREFNADKRGAEICGDPMYLATALEKIHAYAHRVPMQVNPAFNSMFIAEPVSMMERVGRMFQTHPPLEARLENLIGRPTTGMFR